MFFSLLRFSTYVLLYTFQHVCNIDMFLSKTERMRVAKLRKFGYIGKWILVDRYHIDY